MKLLCVSTRCNVSLFQGRRSLGIFSSCCLCADIVFVHNRYFQAMKPRTPLFSRSGQPTAHKSDATSPRSPLAPSQRILKVWFCANVRLRPRELSARSWSSRISAPLPSLSSLNVHFHCTMMLLHTGALFSPFSLCSGWHGQDRLQLAPHPAVTCPRCLCVYASIYSSLMCTNCVAPVLGTSGAGCLPGYCIDFILVATYIPTLCGPGTISARTGFASAPSLLLFLCSCACNSLGRNPAGLWSTGTSSNGDIAQYCDNSVPPCYASPCGSYTIGTGTLVSPRLLLGNHDYQRSLPCFAVDPLSSGYIQPQHWCHIKLGLRRRACRLLQR